MVRGIVEKESEVAAAERKRVTSRAVCNNRSEKRWGQTHGLRNVAHFPAIHNNAALHFVVFHFFEDPEQYKKIPRAAEPGATNELLLVHAAEVVILHSPPMATERPPGREYEKVYHPPI